MPRYRYASPFAYQTPIGASLNNIAQALFSGPGPIEQDKMQAESELRRAQAQKAAEEIRDIEEGRRRRGDDYMEETVALHTGAPLQNVQALGRHARGEVPLPPTFPAGIDVGLVRARLAALRTGIGLDKTSSATDIATAGGKFIDQNREIGAETGRIPQIAIEDVGRARKAHLGQPMYGGDRFVTRDLSSGAERPTALGVAELPNISAQASQRRATAGNQAALADIHRNTARTGITPGPPVMVDVPNIVEGGGGPTSVSPQRTGGFPLISIPRVAPAGGAGGGRLVKVIDADGTEVWMPAKDAAGKAAGGGRAPAQKKPLSKQELGAIDTAIADSAGTDLKNIDGPTLTKIKARAAALALDPDSDWHRNPAGAAEAALAEMGGLEDSRAGIPLINSRFVPKTGPTLPKVSPAGTQPQPGGSAGGYVSPSGKTYTREDIEFTAKKRGMKPEQVIQQMGLQPGA